MPSSPCEMDFGLDSEVHWGERSAVQIIESLCAPKAIILALLKWLGQTQNQLLNSAAAGVWDEP